jgi:hypothetical protein
MGGCFFRLNCRCVTYELSAPWHRACENEEDFNPQPLLLMKLFLNLCCIVSTLCLASLVASEMGFSPSLKERTSDSLTRQAAKGSTLTFSPHVRSKVAQYFDTYRSELNGLPPSCVSATHGLHIPPTWLRSWLPIGTQILENERQALIEVPSELQKSLTAHSHKTIHYFLAGKNLVALDDRSKVVDSIWIPTIRLGADHEVLQLVTHTNR